MIVLQRILLLGATKVFHHHSGFLGCKLQRCAKVDAIIYVVKLFFLAVFDQLHSFTDLHIVEKRCLVL